MPPTTEGVQACYAAPCLSFCGGVEVYQIWLQHHYLQLEVLALAHGVLQCQPFQHMHPQSCGLVVLFSIKGMFAAPPLIIQPPHGGMVRREASLAAIGAAVQLVVTQQQQQQQQQHYKDP